MAYHYQGAEIDDETLDTICGGYDYTIPANTIQMQAQCSRFKNMVPISNQHVYAQQYQEDANFHKYLNDENSMNGFFGSLGVIEVCENLAQEQHRRRDGSQLYSSDSYKRYLRKHIAERDGLQPSNNYLNPAQIIDSNLYPTLGNAGKLLDDGTISITTPSWIGGGADSLRRITLNNEMEQHFEENRQAFLQSIYSQEGTTNNGVIKTGIN